MQSATAPTPTEWIPLPRLADELGVHRRTILVWLNRPDRGLPRPKMIGPRFYFQRREIEEWKLKAPIKPA